MINFCFINSVVIEVISLLKCVDFRSYSTFMTYVKEGLVHEMYC